MPEAEPNAPPDDSGTDPAAPPAPADDTPAPASDPPDAPDDPPVRRDTLDAVLRALVAQARLSLTQIRLAPTAEAAFADAGMLLAPHRDLLEQLAAEGEQTSFQLGLAHGRTDQLSTVGQAVADDAFAWVHTCRIALPTEATEVRAALVLRRARLAAALRMLTASLPLLETWCATNPLARPLLDRGRMLMLRARSATDQRATALETRKAASAQAESLRVRLRSALRALRKAWNDVAKAVPLAPLDVTHSARSVGARSRRRRSNAD